MDMKRIPILTVLLLARLAAANATAAPMAVSKPNILVILTDDLGL